MIWREAKIRFKAIVGIGLKAIACCELCGANVGEIFLAEKRLKRSLVCQHCLDDFPFFNYDLLQGDLLSWPAIYHALPNIHFDSLFSLTPYMNPMAHWLRKFKYQGRFEFSSFFSVLLSSQWQSVMKLSNVPVPDLILSVPLHVNKWQIRGYNQSHLIAKSFAKAVKLPYLASALVRVKKNDSQVGKTGVERRKNLCGAFALTSPLPTQVKHVLLIDDVITTGSTASEISQLLKKAGIERVTLITVCLSLPKT